MCVGSKHGLASPLLPVFRTRRVDASGIITTFAGNGTAAFSADGAAAASTPLNMPTAISFSPLSGAAFVSDTTNHRVRMVDANSSVVTTYAGDGTPAYSGDGAAATSASLFLPMQTAFDAAGNLHVADFNNHVSREGGRLAAAPAVLSVVSKRGHTVSTCQSLI